MKTRESAVVAALRALLATRVGVACATGALAAIPAGAQVVQPIIIELASFGDPATPYGMSGEGSVVVGTSMHTSPTFSRGHVWNTDGTGPTIPLLAGCTSLAATGVSGDGLTVVGRCWGIPVSPAVLPGPGFRWTASGGTQLLPYPANPWVAVTGISRNGLVVVGFEDNPPNQTPGWTGPKACRWVSNGPCQRLALAIGDGASYARAVNADGSVIVGDASEVVMVNGQIQGRWVAIRWTNGGTVAQSLGFLPNPDMDHVSNAIVMSVSDDGEVVSGYSWVYPGCYPCFSQLQAFRWTLQGGMQAIGPVLSSGGVDTLVMSGDGNTVSFGTGFIYRRGFATETLTGYLVSRGVNLTGWDQLVPTAISQDGLVLAGKGRHFNVQRAWRIDLRIDTDGDGLLDDWEVNGIPWLDAAGAIHRYLLPYANPLRKDLYVEVDWMPGQQPMPEAISRVIDAFDVAAVPPRPGIVAGIALHVDLTQSDGFIPPRPYPGKFTEFQQDKAVYFGTATERGTSGWDLPNGMRAAKAKAYRYCIFAHSFESGSTSGVAEIGGNDFMVTLGTWSNVTEDIQAGTFMHELGHTLGLLHGGDQEFGPAWRFNGKQNYFSVMNYMWQVPNAKYMPPGTGPGQWGRYFPNFSEHALSPLFEGGLVECRRILGNLPDVKVPYSIPVGTITSGNTSPCVGVPSDLCVDYAYGAGDVSCVTGGVDWNQDGWITRTPVAANINAFESTGVPFGTDILLGHDDWAALKYNFRESRGYADGFVETDTLVDMNLADYALLDSFPFPSRPACPFVAPVAGAPSPAAAPACGTGNATFTITAQGMPPFSCYWRWFDHVQTHAWVDLVDGVMANGTVVQGADRPTLSLASVSAADLAPGRVRFSCRIVNTCGQTSDSGECTMWVGGLLVTVTTPTVDGVCIGAGATMLVAAEGEGEVGYRWEMMNRSISFTWVDIEDGTLPGGTVLAGSGTATLAISNAQVADLPELYVVFFRCVATDGCGRSRESEGITLGIQGAAVALGPTDVEVPCAGAPEAVFTVGAIGHPVPVYSWLKDGVALGDGGRISGATTATLTIANPVGADAGAYWCHVSNSCGDDTSASALLHAGPPRMLVDPPAPLLVCAGDRGTVRAEVIGAKPLAFRWMKNGVDLQNGARIEGANAQEMSIANMQPSDAGTYSVRVTNDCGVAVSAGTSVALVGAVGIAEQPHDVTTCPTGTATMSVTPSTAGSLTYWLIENPARPNEWWFLFDGAMDFGPGTCAMVTGSDTPTATLALTGLPGFAGTRLQCQVYGPCLDLAMSNTARLRVCRADFNCSGQLEVADIFDYLDLWFAGDLAADIDGSGGLAVQDIFDFLDLWFEGCA